jgi:hypothetical protein
MFLWVFATLWAHIFGSRAWFSSGTPIGEFSLSVCWVAELQPATCGGLLVCYMALSVSEVYDLNAEELCKACEERGLETGGPVKTLRASLAVNVLGKKMEKSTEVKAAQAGVQPMLRIM